MLAWSGAEPVAAGLLPQAQNWCQAMCLNPARTRRRLRRLLEDWNNLGGHAANADAAPETVAALEAAGWRWQGLGADDPQACTRLYLHHRAAIKVLQARMSLFGASKRVADELVPGRERSCCHCQACDLFRMLVVS